MPSSPEYHAARYQRLKKDPHRCALVKKAQDKYSKTAPRVEAQKIAKAKNPNRQSARMIVGVDGEGEDTPDGRHIYTYLAAVNERGRLVAEARNPNGLTHEECVSMLLQIPQNTLKFGFMFSYDVTKIIEDMSETDRYLLMRPQARAARSCRDCKTSYAGRVTECANCGSKEMRSYTRQLSYKDRKYDFFNGSFTVTEPAIKAIKKGERVCKVWDCFRFFGKSFVACLKDWSNPDMPLEDRVATPEQIARISAMKDKRGAFDAVDDKASIEAYCQEECHLLAVMMRKLIDAHDAAEIHLTRYEGAGSTATAMLKKHAVHEYRGPRTKELEAQYGPGLTTAIASAFFGGRFENSRIGLVDQKVYSADVNSAYPYALTQLPCLECGSWMHYKKIGARKVKALLKKSRLCVARFKVGNLSPEERHKMAWAPLPFRDEDGSIAYGLNFSGWAWAQELLPALEGWPDLVSLSGECWVYETFCEHEPFSFLPAIYRKRCEWGKDGRGTPLKLGPNASYGKCAQSIGEDPLFQSWPWAGACTATTRGQLLGGITRSKDRWSVLALATDGMISTEKLIFPKAVNTGTHDLSKPLGEWDRAIYKGIFLIKPGLYWKTDAKEDQFRARGLGRREAYAEKDRLMAGFRSWDRKNMAHVVKVNSRRFYGAKHSVQGRAGCTGCRKTWSGVPEAGCPKCGRMGDQFNTKLQRRVDGKPAYGTWDLRIVNIAFDPHPKRLREIRRGGKSAKLHLRDLGGRESAPYKAGMTTPEGMAAREGKDFALEQPDWHED